MNKCIPEDAGWILDEYDAEAFWSRVGFHGGDAWREDPLVDTSRVSGECWAWQGATESSSQDHVYGTVMIWRKKHRAHRISYRDFGNKLGSDKEIDHLCRNTICVRPSHLESVLHEVNVQRGRQPLLNRGICRNGHLISDANLAIRKRGDKEINACKTCLSASRRRTYLKRKASGKI